MDQIACIVIAEVPQQDWIEKSQETNTGTHGNAYGLSPVGQQQLTEHLQTAGFENVRVLPASEAKSLFGGR